MENKTKIYISIISVLGALVVALSIILGIYIAKTNKKPSYWEQKYSSFAVQNANASKGQIAFIGDSITDLYPLDNYYSDLPLATYNRGIGGDTTLGVLKRLDVSLFDIAPSKIVLMIGINDINSGRTNQEVYESYKEILNKIKAKLPDTEVFCISLIPIYDSILEYISIDLNERNNQIMQFNQMIEPLAEEYGYIYLNLFELVETSDHYLRHELTDDGLHLNANGFEIWTNLLKPHLI